MTDMLRGVPVTALNLLAELTALVRGECPSLLNEDSGGDGALSVAIDALLAAPLPLRSEKEQEELQNVTRVDGERRAAGPTGSTAADLEAIPTLLELRMQRIELFRRLALVEAEIQRRGGVVDGRNV